MRYFVPFLQSHPPLCPSPGPARQACPRGIGSDTRRGSGLGREDGTTHVSQSPSLGGVPGPWPPRRRCLVLSIARVRAGVWGWVAATGGRRRSDGRFEPWPWPLQSTPVALWPVWCPAARPSALAACVAPLQSERFPARAVRRCRPVRMPVGCRGTASCGCMCRLCWLRVPK